MPRLRVLLRVSITFAPWDEDGNKVVKIISDYLETKVIVNSKHQRFCHIRLVTSVKPKIEGPVVYSRSNSNRGFMQALGHRYSLWKV